MDFDTAIRRAAQITFDLRYDGVPVVFSWPSRGSTLSYIGDAAVVRHSGRNLSHFLDKLVEHAGVDDIHILAHSMGNRALTDALELMALRRAASRKTEPAFEEVLFAAPDVDAGLFRAMAETFRTIARRMTVYGSSEDVALDVSRRVHGDAHRAGEGGEHMETYAGIDSIDMSAAGSDMLAHSYFAEDSAALLDMLTLIWRGSAPDKRCGLTADTQEDGVIWRLEAGKCEDKRLFEVITGLRRAGITEMKEAQLYLDNLSSELGSSDEIRTIVSKLFEETSQ